VKKLEKPTEFNAQTKADKMDQFPHQKVGPIDAISKLCLHQKIKTLDSLSERNKELLLNIIKESNDVQFQFLLENMRLLGRHTRPKWQIREYTKWEPMLLPNGQDCHGGLDAGSTTQACETREGNEDNIQEVVPIDVVTDKCIFTGVALRGSIKEAKIQNEVRK